MGHRIDNSKSTIQKLTALYCDPELSDLRLLVGDRTFHAHKLILSISSDVFKTMLTSPTWPESYTNQITLQEEPECIEVFGDFLWYLYTGHVNLCQHSVLSVLILADKYNIKDLSDVCIQYMCSHYVAQKRMSQVVSWFKYAIMCDHKKLGHICEQYITWNFQTIMETPDFMNISPDMIIELLRCPEVVVDSEYNLYRKIRSWVRHKVTNRELKLKSKKPELDLEKFIGDIGQLIDFNMMSSAELTTIMRDDLVSQFGHILMPRITKAFTFHENLEECSSKQSMKANECTQIKFSFSQICRNCEMGRSFKSLPRGSVVSRPCGGYKSLRNYTCDCWSTEMEVTDISRLNPGDVQGAFFSTPTTGSEADETCWDWHIDLYPKGVTFKKCMMIGHYMNYELDEVFYNTVRLTVISNSTEARNARISILVYGKQEGIEYIAKCITRTCYFDGSHAVQNFNDIVDYSELHDPCHESKSLRIKIIICPLKS